MFLFEGLDLVTTENTVFNRFWLFLPFGYLLTILIETPVLLVGLAPKISLRQKLWCGVWLTACTYPVVVLVLPALMQDFSRFAYLLIAETFAPAGECFLFWLAFRAKDSLDSKDWIRCFAAIVLANLASFGAGEILNIYGWFGLF